MYCVHYHNCVHHHNCNVVKKHCCSCSLLSDVGVQTDFSDKQTNNYKNIDPHILIIFSENFEVVVIMVINQLLKLWLY